MNETHSRLGDYMTSRRSKGKEGLPTLSVTLDRGLVRRDSLDRKTDTNLEPKQHLRVLPGDIAYNMMRMWQGASGLADIEALVSPAYVVLAPKPNLDPRYAAYLFKTARMIHNFWAYSYGLTNDRLRLYPSDALKVPVDIPPLPEQRKIADILSTWDRAIEVSEALLSTARTQKRALMQSLLTGKRRFPEFEGSEWKEVRLGDVSRVDQRSLGSKTEDDFEFDYISLSNVEPGRIVGELDRLRYADAPSRARRKVSINDLLVSTVRPNLMGFAKVGEKHRNCIASTGFAVVTPGKTANSSYLFHYLFSHHMKSQFHALVVGSNYPAINSSDVKKLKINLPPLSEQEKIGSVLDACDLEIDDLNAGIRSLRTEKKALMQQLLTGKRRVMV
ncbi:restriction endonuclease subunit S [uncultured Roseobacter sp.]|uniref:restriction endonuclease subunit S n=1 Tax=uncultured Roseobacter sp. TaxID=114847 RepID=UPI0026018F94|nr:restriction endonuclease subunit S [uncultured Roseobacter sp.]